MRGETRCGIDDPLHPLKGNLEFNNTKLFSIK